MESESEMKSGEPNIPFLKWIIDLVRY